MAIDNMKVKVGQIRGQLSPFIRKITHDWSFAFSALIAYYLLITLIPLIICIFSGTVLLFGRNNAILVMMSDRLNQTFPNKHLTEIIDSLVTTVTTQALMVFIISFFIAVFTTSRLFIGIDNVLTIIYRIRERNIFKKNLHAIRMLLVFMILITIIIICISLPTFLKRNRFLYHIITVIFGSISTFILLIIIYYYVPQRIMYWRKIWAGALFVTMGLLILFLIFPVYVRLFMTNYVGQLGFVIITLLLFYFFGLLFIIGAQINAYYFEHIQPLPVPLGNFICEYASQEHLRLIDIHSNSNNHMLTLTEELRPFH